MYAQPHGQPRPRRPYHQRFNATRRINLSGPQVWIAGLGATVITAFLLGLLGVGFGGWIGYLIAGFIGACLLIAIGRMFRR